MFLCYVDESGTSAIPGNTSHFVLTGLAIPSDKWKACDDEVEQIKGKYNLLGAEIHTGWILRNYIEQSKISNFKGLSFQQRTIEVQRYRTSELLRLQKAKNKVLYKQTKKSYKKTEKYCHLTRKERDSFIDEVAAKLSKWTFARLFAECVDKVHYSPIKTKKSIDEQAFEQIVSRLEQFLTFKNESSLLIHDNNPTIALRHTELMKMYHSKGTLWTKIERIIETSLFVDSQLTSMVQLADLCSYAIRRYLENSERELFDKVFSIADKNAGGKAVGIRHFTNQTCACTICTAHRSEVPKSKRSN